MTIINNQAGDIPPKPFKWTGLCKTIRSNTMLLVIRHCQGKKVKIQHQTMHI